MSVRGQILVQNEWHVGVFGDTYITGAGQRPVSTSEFGKGNDVSFAGIK
jgi:hypothetical protein